MVLCLLAAYWWSDSFLRLNDWPTQYCVNLLSTAVIALALDDGSWWGWSVPVSCFASTTPKSRRHRVAWPRDHAVPCRDADYFRFILILPASLTIHLPLARILWLRYSTVLVQWFGERAFSRAGLAAHCYFR